VSMPSRTPAPRVGPRARIEPEVVRKLFEDSGLSKADFAALAGASVRRMKKGGYASNTVTQWISGERQMSADTYEVLTTRLRLLKENVATFAELVSQPLEEIVGNLLEWIFMPKPEMLNTEQLLLIANELAERGKTESAQVIRDTVAQIRRMQPVETKASLMARNTQK